MDEKHDHVHRTPLVFALTSCWLLLCIVLAHSQPSPPPLCAEQSYECTENVSTILDPFWGQNPPSQCNGGDASSHLICYGVYESKNVTVKDINHTTHTMKVMLMLGEKGSRMKKLIHFLL
ncbi:hypothetical protein DEO72_LG5g266 [Vigna unguiculata]|uniref:Uncharacterized protein n=1 Tax=Vigna unguiculata TaxID=3917 RepID=A0A4D6LUD8_VIGUN|nr:hypothetical protein DEO72_LG5g266 [Vigna unguiculata]